MDVVSFCALCASGFEWQPGPGSYALTVICKATFELRPNDCVLASEQEEIADTDTYWNDDERRSLVVPSDLAPYKLRADVVLVGHAYAPRQQPARSIMTRLVVGEVDKSIEVFCDRGLRLHDGQLIEGTRQAKMRLTWERAAGGPDTNNPVGLRFDAAPDSYGVVAIPSLQPPGVQYSQWGDTFVPVGYGPIAPHWPARTQRLYLQHAAGFAASGWEQQPLPEHFDYAYFTMAPPDQQLVELRSNERIVLENLHPQHERLVTNLPGIQPRAVVDRATGEREEIALVADTLWIDTDRGICTVVWRGRIGLRHSGESGRVAFWADGLPKVEVTSAVPGHGPVDLNVEPSVDSSVEPSVDSDVEPGVDSSVEEITNDELEVDTFAGAEEESTGNDPVLPFVKSEPARPSLVGIAAAAPPDWLGARANIPIRGTETMVVPAAEPAKAPLPFVQKTGGPPNPAPPPPTSVPVPPLPTSMPVPPLPASVPVPPPLTSLPVPPLPASVPLPPLATSVSLPPLPASVPVPPPVFLAGPTPLLFAAADEEPETRSSAKPAAKEPVQEARPQDIAPPSMIGPLAVVAMAPDAGATPEGAKTDVAPPATPAPQTPAAPVQEEPKLKEFPLERCAALTAHIARNKPDKARILEEEELSAEQWAAIEKHWADAIRAEAKKGRKTLLDRFDAAYVEQLEKERGPITVQDYAKITVAAERESTDEAMEALTLPRGAVMRIERVWIQRIAKDPSLEEKVGEAVEAERRS